MFDLAALREKVIELGAILGLPPDSQRLPVLREVEGFWMEVEGERLCLCFRERREITRYYFNSEDDLLYYVFSLNASRLASHYAAQPDPESFFRVHEAKRLELLGRLNPPWAKREEEAIKAILAHNRAEGWTERLRPEPVLHVVNREITAPARVEYDLFVPPTEGEEALARDWREVHLVVETPTGAHRAFTEPVLKRPVWCCYSLKWDVWPGRQVVPAQGQVTVTVRAEATTASGTLPIHGQAKLTVRA